MRLFSKSAAALAISVIFAVTAGASYADGAVRCVDREDKVVALTFDDGPHPTLTEGILDLLEKYDARATFFIIGKNAGYYPDVIRMAVDHGHEIGNHTHSHISLAGRGKNDVKSEIMSAEDDILSVCGVKTRLFRPPEGCISKNVTSAAAELGYDVILWNIDTRDWAHCSTADMVRNIKSNVRPGSIILFHDYTSGTAHTKDVLCVIIPYLISQGYRFVTVSELMKI